MRLESYDMMLAYIGIIIFIVAMVQFTEMRRAVGAIAALAIPAIYYGLFIDPPLP